MHDDRCLTCDRVIATPDNVDDGMCEVELSFNSRRRTSDWNRRARRDCAAHAVDWRARALAAEAERDGYRKVARDRREAAFANLVVDSIASCAATTSGLDELVTALGAKAPHAVEAAISDLVSASRDLEVYAEGKVTAKRTRSAEAEFERSRTALRAAIAAKIDHARVSAREEFDHARRVFFEDMLQRRDITSPCQECEGYGVRAYPSTATWHRGAGGQMITSDVCDRCWGSGDAVKRGVDLRKMASAASALPPIDDDAQELIDGLVAANRPDRGKRTKIAAAAPATVGDFVIEYADPIAPSVWIGQEKPTHKIRQLRAGRVRSWSSGGGWDAWGTAMMRVDFDLPARMITDAAEAEADPSSRWPLVAATPPEDPAR